VVAGLPDGTTTCYFVRRSWMTLRKSFAVFGPMVLVLVSLAGCPQPTTMLTGDAAAGQTLFAQDCARCHSAASVAGGAALVTNNLGSINAGMNGITLTDQQVTEIKAFLETQ
jgi:mono/diheme cytochrome c family protein